MRQAIVVGLIVVAGIIGAFVYPSWSSSARSFTGAPSPRGLGAMPGVVVSPAPSFGEIPREDDGALTRADGVLPDGATVFDDAYPGIANLDPDLLRALREAAKRAADRNIEIDVTSGWRSAAYQDQLLREAVSKYGSVKEAERWVATPDTSPHVSGDAVDVGPEATAWLSKHGASYGLCQIYRNEPWHFELRPVVDQHCPAMYADPTHDPRMH
jgi:zinc D-Ala-D-Ala carboxypeptidase